MNKRAALGAVAAIALVAVLIAGVYYTTWDMNYTTPQPINTDPTPGAADFDNSLNYIIFEQYGPLLIVLALLMFGAMVGGICIAREETEKTEDEEDDWE